MKPVRILSISDLHFGNTHIDPESLSRNFRTYVIPRFTEIDILFVAGDFFDTALSLSDNITPSVLTSMFDLLTAAAQSNVTVRFLRGTFSHERTQCRYFPIIHKQYKFTNDLQYFDTISLEYIEKYDLRVLYLPDDLPYPNSNAIMAVVQEKLKEFGWDYVDYAIVHGYFEHVVPVGAVRPKNTYTKADFYFVRRYVLIGHVHTPSTVDKFIHNGSFDRLVHGEEEPKGFVIIDDTGTTARVQFIENTQATKFITLDYTDFVDEEAAMEHFKKEVSQYSDDVITNIRVKHPNAAWRQGLSKFVKQHYSNIILSVKAPKTNDANDERPFITVTDFTTFVKPTSETLPALILEHGDLHTKPSTLTEERIKELLKTAAIS